MNRWCRCRRIHNCTKDTNTQSESCTRIRVPSCTGRSYPSMRSPVGRVMNPPDGRRDSRRTVAGVWPLRSSTGMVALCSSGISAGWSCTCCGTHRLEHIQAMSDMELASAPENDRWWQRLAEQSRIAELYPDFSKVRAAAVDVLEFDSSIWALWVESTWNSDQRQRLGRGCYHALICGRQTCWILARRAV